MMTQKEIFDKAKELNKESLGSISGVYTEEESKQLMEIALCYNKTMELIKTLALTEQQKSIFFEKASSTIYSERQLEQIAFAVCSLYKSEYQIKENAEEKLNLMCNPSFSPIRMSQIWIGITKDLTLDEINECLSVSDEEIVEKTKQVFCKHYDKVYTAPKKEEIEEER